MTAYVLFPLTSYSQGISVSMLLVNVYRVPIIDKLVALNSDERTSHQNIWILTLCPLQNSCPLLRSEL